MRLAIINDYQELALDTADWNSLPESVQVDVFHDQLTDTEEAAARLARGVQCVVGAAARGGLW